MADEPVPLRRSLDRVVRSLGAPSVDATASLFDDWEAIVGPVAAAHIRPLKVVGNTLHVVVDDPAWATQLRWLEPQILQAAGDSGVAAVAARVRP